MRRGDLYRVARPGRADSKAVRVFAVVARQAVIDSRFSTVICAPVYSARHGLASQVPVGVDEGLKHDSALHCDELRQFVQGTPDLVRRPAVASEDRGAGPGARRGPGYRGGRVKAVTGKTWRNHSIRSSACYPKGMKKFLLAALAFTVLASAQPLAHPGHDHKLMGSITAIDGNKVTLKTTEGKTVTFQVIPTTSFKRDKIKGTQADLKVGMRVVANVGDGSEPLKAKEVQYTAPATTAK